MYDAVLMRDSRMAFGGINGFNIFRPSEIVDNADMPRACITSLEINGVRSSDYLEESSPVRRCPKMKLGSTENNLVFRFSAMHYVYPERNRYRYMLVGLDDDWHFTDGRAPSAFI